MRKLPLARLPLPSIRNWLQTGPNAIAAYPGEKELLRTGTILVTDTRLAYIDAFDRTLKTYMFEHMLSVNKHYYRPTSLNRRLCKGVILAAIVVLLITIIVDMTSGNHSSMIMVYIPLLMSLVVGLLVWRDMRPRYSVEWEMTNGTKGKISTEPLMREWLLDNRNREKSMDRLAHAMNEALSAKAWWPKGSHANQAQMDMFVEPASPEKSIAVPGEKPKLTLVNSLYDH
jgi:hypothetical protein